MRKAVLVAAMAVLVLFTGSTGPLRSAAAAPPAGRELFSPPTGFWIMRSDGSNALYGPTSASADWTVAQWNIPTELPTFQNGVTQNQFARVSIEADGSVTLSQYGDALSCRKQYASGMSDVHEFDLFLRPNNGTPPGYPKATTGPSARLGELSHIFHAIEVEPRSVEAKDASCQVTKAVFLTAIVLANPSKRQTIFYQLRLGAFTAIGSSLSSINLPPFWFGKGTDPRTARTGYFGYDDSISSYEQEPVAINKPSKFALDLLPRFTALIREGAQFELDQNLSHWIISGAYHGEIVWGHIRVSSHWQNFSLAAQQK